MPRLALSAKIFIFSMFVLVFACDDDVDRRRELDVAADVIAVRVRVDQERDRLRRQLLDLVEDRLAPAGVLRVDDGDAVGGDEHGGVAAAAAQDEQVVVRASRPATVCVCAALARGRDANRQSAHEPPACRAPSALHRSPPDKNTRSTNQNPPAAMTADRAGDRDPPASLGIPSADRRQRRRGGDDDEQLPDLDADVEREQRPAQRPRRQVHLAQHVGEAEAVDQAEDERDPGPDVAALPDQEVVDADVDDAERDRRLDDAGGRTDEAERRQRQRDAVREREPGHDQQQPAERAARAAAGRSGTADGRDRSGCDARRTAGTCARPRTRPGACRRSTRTTAASGRESPA